MSSPSLSSSLHSRESIFDTRKQCVGLSQQCLFEAHCHVGNVWRGVQGVANLEPTPARAEALECPALSIGLNGLWQSAQGRWLNSDFEPTTRSVRSTRLYVHRLVMDGYIGHPWCLASFRRAFGQSQQPASFSGLRDYQTVLLVCGISCVVGERLGVESSKSVFFDLDNRVVSSPLTNHGSHCIAAGLELQKKRV